MKKKCGFMVWLVFLLFLTVSFTVSGTGGKEPEKAEEVMEITWLMRIKSDEGTSWANQEIEKKFNVRIIPNGIDANADREKVSVMLAAGEFPDCGMYLQTYDLFNEGVTRVIPKDMIKKYAPGYTRLLTEEYPLGWMAYRNPENENEYVAITAIDAIIDGTILHPTFRIDWARNLGFDLPNYEKNKVALDKYGACYFLDEDITLDWLERLMIAFRDGDADGNGKIDTIPFEATASFSFWWSWVMGAFGVAEGYNLMVDGKLTECCIAPGYKDFLKLAARWYKIGLVDKEFTTLDRSKLCEKIAAGLVGVSTGVTDYLGSKNRPPNCFVTDEDVAEGAEVVVLPPPIGPNGIQGSRCFLSVGPAGYAPFAVNKSVTDAKLAKILQILDYTRFSGDEGWVYYYAGKPGIHFEWEGEPWKSYPIVEKDLDKIPAGYPKQGKFGCVYPHCYSMDKIQFVRNEHLASFYQNYILEDKNMSLTLRPYKWDFLTETKLNDLKSKYGDTLKTIVDEFRLKAIIGELDIDAEWDEYVSKWRKNGGDAMLAELMKAPIVAELRKGKLVY